MTASSAAIAASPFTFAFTRPRPENSESPIIARRIIAASAAVILLRAILDDKYKSAEDIRKYAGLVNLAVVPLEDSDVDIEKKNSTKSRRTK